MIIKLVLFVFLFFIVLVLLLGVSLIRSAKNVFFGSGDKHTGRHQATRTEEKSGSGHNETRRSYGFRKRKKIIGKDEGEYVDYEEIKE